MNGSTNEWLNEWIDGRRNNERKETIYNLRIKWTQCMRFYELMNEKVEQTNN